MVRNPMVDAADSIMVTDAEIRGLQQQITSLGDRMEKSFEKLEKLMSGMDDRVRAVETREAGCQPFLTSKISDAFIIIGEHERKIDAVEKALSALVHTNNILKWLLGISTAGLTALLIKLIVGV